MAQAFYRDGLGLLHGLEVVIPNYAARGIVHQVILGCTAVRLLFAVGDAGVPLFDTTALHARAAA
jgi:aspartate racemase